MSEVVSIDAVVFDMDGTLIDSTMTVPAAYGAAIFELSGRRCTDAEVIAEYGAGPAAALISRFTGRPGTDSDVECWLRHLEARLHRSVAYPGIHAAIERLSANGIGLGVFTGATRRAAQLQLEHFDLFVAFDAIVGSDEVAAVKPAPDGILRACALLGVAPERAAYVGDAVNDVRCAHAAGAIAIAAAWGHLYQPEGRPHHIAETAHDLVDFVLAHNRGTSRNQSDRRPRRGHQNGSGVASR